MVPLEDATTQGISATRQPPKTPLKATLQNPNSSILLASSTRYPRRRGAQYLAVDHLGSEERRAQDVEDEDHHPQAHQVPQVVKLLERRGDPANGVGGEELGLAQYDYEET